MAEGGLRASGRPPLAARWRVARSEPGAPPPAPDSPEWIESARAQTAAAALRDAGTWSLAATAIDFDASDWWFTASFDAPAMANPVLGLEGLATVAQVSLNGEPLLASRNMFRAHRVDLTGRLAAGANELRIRCAALVPELAQRRPRPRWRAPMVAHQQLRWLRTTLLGRTPGWSPPAAAVGPWRNVWLAEAVDAIEVDWLATLDGPDGRVRLALQAPPGWAEALESAHLVVTREGREQRQPLTKRGKVWTADLLVPQPVLWWPHTHGEPALHEVRLELQDRRGGKRAWLLGRAGFRRIDIVTAGDGFALRVNGERVFCRGAGWTPLDPVSLRATPQALHDAVAQARAGGANMLRLAGTMVMEEDAFYDACDELGVLVWQDFMFASMDYPFDDAGFAADALDEARDQVRRLACHPCLAVFCGNSEVEQQAAMWGAPRELWQPRFFHHELRDLCATQAPHVPYWPSSAHGGAFPHSASSGTTSYYGVGAYERPLEDARRSGLRFATECLAFAGIPPATTLERLPGGAATQVHHPQWKARSPRDLGVGWDFDDVRDHYVQRLFGVDPVRLRHAEPHRYLALGRLAVAEAMQAAFAEWRRPASGCGGALLLFLRDLWAGAGWGVLDDAGMAKSGWHALTPLWQPRAAFFTDEGGNGVDLHLVNDTAVPLAASVELTAWREPAVRVAGGSRAVEVPARGGTTLSCLDVIGTFLDLNHAYRFGPPACDMLLARLLDEKGGDVARAVHFPQGLASLIARPRAEVGLRATVMGARGGEARVAIATRDLAIDVQVDVPGWAAAQDHFHLAPGEERQVTLHRLREGAALAGRVAATNSLADAELEAQA